MTPDPVADLHHNHDIIDLDLSNNDPLETTAPTITSGEIRSCYGLLSSGPKGTFSFVWQNPEVGDIVVTRLAIYIRIPAEEKAELDVGTAIDGTSHSDDIMGCIDLTRPDTIWEFTGKAEVPNNSFVTAQITRSNAYKLRGLYYMTYEGV